MSAEVNPNLQLLTLTGSEVLGGMVALAPKITALMSTIPKLTEAESEEEEVVRIDEVIARAYLDLLGQAAVLAGEVTKEDKQVSVCIRKIAAMIIQMEIK